MLMEECWLCNRKIMIRPSILFALYSHVDNVLKKQHVDKIGTSMIV